MCFVSALLGDGATEKRLLGEAVGKFLQCSKEFS